MKLFQANSLTSLRVASSWLLMNQITPSREMKVLPKWQSQASNAMCKIRAKVDHYSVWRIVGGDIDVWCDNWSDKGPLWAHLLDGSRLRKLKLKNSIKGDTRNWDAETIRNYIKNSLFILKPKESDVPICTLDIKGIFTISSAWQLLRQKRQKTWMNSMTWKKSYFKMSFMLWRSLKDKIPTDLKNGYDCLNSSLGRYCCIKPHQIFCNIFFGDE